MEVARFTRPAVLNPAELSPSRRSTTSLLSSPKDSSAESPSLKAALLGSNRAVAELQLELSMARRIAQSNADRTAHSAVEHSQASQAVTRAEQTIGELRLELDERSRQLREATRLLGTEVQRASAEAEVESSERQRVEADLLVVKQRLAAKEHECNQWKDRCRRAESVADALQRQLDEVSANAERLLAPYCHPMRSNNVRSHWF